MSASSDESPVGAASKVDRSTARKDSRRATTVSLAVLTAVGYAYLAWVQFGPGPGLIADSVIAANAAETSTIADSVIADEGFTFWWYSAFFARTFAFHAGLALCGVVVAALWCRRWRTAAAGVLVVALLVGPDVRSCLPRAAGSTGPADFRVMTMNLLWVNTNPAAAIAQIRRADPDVLVLQEYTRLFHAALLRALSDRYRFRLCDPGDGHAFGAAILSKFPFTEDQRLDAAHGLGQLSAPRVVVRVGVRKVIIHGVHLVPPMRHNVSFMLRQLRALRSMIEQETDPIIVAGDFNFTTRSSMHAAMVQLELADAQEVAGTGRGATWPRLGLLRVLPGLGIDHVYVGNGLTATKCRVGEDFGSDHRPLIVDVRFE